MHLAVCKDRLKDLYHEARIQAIRDFHANVLGENIKKPQIRQRMNSREADLTQAQYEQVIKYDNIRSDSFSETLH